jgi:Tat protein translocase TatB subunit
MFGVGYQEMFIVLVVALVIFGPSRLPELAGQVGRWVRDFRRMSADLTGEFEKTFAEVDEVKKSFKREMQSIQDEVEGVGKSARGELKKSTGKGQGGKKSGSLKTGTAGSSATRAQAAATNKTTKAIAATGANGAKKDASALAGALPVATKADPLVDVSFFDADVVESPNGAVSNGALSDDVNDALTRVRRRRASASYAQRRSN